MPTGHLNVRVVKRGLIIVTKGYHNTKQYTKSGNVTNTNHKRLIGRSARGHGGCGGWRASRGPENGDFLVEEASPTASERSERSGRLSLRVSRTTRLCLERRMKVMLLISDYA